jgi:pimeloyl-ACP methyl ester carboxylesterase
MSFLAEAWGPWACIAVAATLAAGLWALSARSRGIARLAGRAGALLAGTAAGAMIIGAGAMALRAGEMARQRPAAGVLVDVGGARAFVTCDGEKRGPTLVLISGGYGAGGFMAPLRTALGPNVRACLVDRAGTGFADAAPQDRSVSTIVREIRMAVRGAGEAGPLVLIGHSMGGLYAANFAQAFPDDVAGLVVLDPTPPQWFEEQQSLYGCAPRSDILIAATAFGLGLVPALNPMHGPGAQTQAAAIGPAWSVLVDQESRPMTLAAGARAGQAACERRFDLVSQAGALGSVPILAIVQTETDPPPPPPGLTQRERANWRALRGEWPTAYTRLSDTAKLLRAEPGAGHLFPIERAQWTATAIAPFLASLSALAAPGAPTP